VLRGTFKLRLIWVSVVPTSLVNKSSSFLKVLLPEIVVNGALLSMMDVGEEGCTDRRNKAETPQGKTNKRDSLKS
jgi:hypothetical protein